MLINPQILILPDIHGRDFYKDALKEAVELGVGIVCIGDYLDPYPCEELHEGGVSRPLRELKREPMLINVTKYGFIGIYP